MPPSIEELDEVVEAELDDEAPASGGSLSDEVRAMERRRILEALEQCAGNQTRAAEKLGITRRALIHRLETYGVPRPRKR